MNQRMKHLQILVLSAVVLSMGYSNCGVVAPTHSRSPASGSDSALQAYCEQTLKEAFASSYRPLLANPSTCLQCHTEGGTSPFKFASSDFSTAFSDFLRLGPDAIDKNAVSAGHAPGGYTGPHNEPAFAAARQAFDPSFNDYLACLGNSSGSDALNMIEKNVQDLYFDSNINSPPITLIWDLSGEEVSPIRSRVPAFFTMRVKVQYETRNGSPVPVGYIFSDPSVQMTTGEQELEVEGVIVRINGVQVPGMEAFLSARNIARKVQPVAIYSGQVAVPMASVSTADKISVSFGYFELRARTDTPVIPPTPTITVTTPYTNGANAVRFTVNAPTAIRYCLSASSTPPASTAAPCASLISPVVGNGWLTAAPNQFTIPTSVQGPFTFYLWIANSDLKLNTAPGVGTVTLDSAPPAAPTLTSVTAGSTQIADLNGLSNSNETVSWCALESNLRTGVEINNPSNACFSTTKPSYVGLKGDGTRYIAVFVRDNAGNLTRSATHTVVNTFGKITYTQLVSIEPVASARAVFRTRCFSCHESTAAQAARWNASTYSDSYAKRTQIRSIASTSPPVTHPAISGLTDKEKALINLWLDQAPPSE